MAQQETSKGSKIRNLSIVAHIASIYWFKELNHARSTGNYGKLDELQKSFAENGWFLSGDGTIDVENLTGAYRERAIKERTARWEELKLLSQSDSTKLVDLSVFEEMYTDGKGKLLPIDYLGVSGNRRGSVYFAAMVDRRKENQPLMTEVPVTVKTYSNTLERLKDQIHENEGKSLGFLEMSDVDRLLAAMEAVQLGATQADLRKAFKDGMGQKLWGVIQLNKRFPALNIIERMKLAPDADSHIRLKSVKFSDMPDLVLRTDAKALEEKNQKRKTQGQEAIKPATQDEIAEYFANGGQDGNEPKIMPKANIQGLANEFPATPLRRVAEAIVTNSVDGLKPYRAAAVGLNAVEDLISNGQFPLVEGVLSRIVSLEGDARLAFITKLSAVTV